MEVGEYGTFIEARTRREAENYARRRGMGEVVAGQSLGGHDVPRVSELVRKARTPRQKLDCLHAATFLGYMALQSKVCQPFEVLGDQGIVHEIIHSFAGGGRPRAELSAELARIEGLIPGFPKVRARRRKPR